MASRYWVGGSGNWDNTTTTHWSTSSGGSGGASVPTSTDNVFVNGSSGGGTITVTYNAVVCANLTFTGFSGTFTGTGAGLRVYGDLVLSSSMTWSHQSFIDMIGTSSHTINTSGITLTNSSFRMMDTGTYTLQDHLVMTGTLNPQRGHFDANDYNVTCGVFSSSTSYARTVTMGSGLWTTTNGTVTSPWNVSASTLLTFNKETANIKITGSSSVTRFFGGGDLTYNEVWVASTGSGTLRFDGSNTFGTLKIDAGRSVIFNDGTVTTTGSLVATGTIGNHITLSGYSTGGWTITRTSGTNTVSYCDISYSSAIGGASWDASDGTNTDNGHNTGWYFGGFVNPDNAFVNDGNYATAPSSDGVLSVSVSNDAGSVYSGVLTRTFATEETTEEYGEADKELWGLSWTGTSVSATNFLVKISATDGTNIKFTRYTGFTFSPPAQATMTGIHVSITGKWDGATLSVNYVSVMIHYGSSVLPIEPGSMVYASDGRKNGEGAGVGTGVLVYYDATGDWIASDTGTVVQA